MGRQPLLHDLAVVVRAPTAVLSHAGGDIHHTGVEGAFHGDVRVLSQAEVRVAGEPVEPITWWLDGPSSAVFVSVIRSLGDEGPDPTVRLLRRRTATATGLRETLRVECGGDRPVATGLSVDLAADLAAMHEVKAGAAPPASRSASLSHAKPATWLGEAGLTVTVRAPDAIVTSTQCGVRLEWRVELTRGQALEVSWSLEVTDPGGVVVGAGRPAPWAAVEVECDDRRVEQLVARSVADLDALRLAMTDRPEAEFFAAGAPWFLTLFGRDSLWAARLALPLGVELAASTLEVLAARQGELDDARTGEAPGKILHEVRRPVAVADGSWHLPPVYFGTIDATALWVALLHDAWCWGLAGERIEPLLPHLERAMAWITGAGDADGDGFVEYVDSSGRGLANQGWKDSGDSVRFRDGAIASGAIALAEVQGYAHEAALGAARLLHAFDRPGADRLEEYAAGLRERFRRSFWVEDERGPYPAMALDGAKRPVDALTSNIGHLLGTGLLDDAESALVAGRLGTPDLASGFGLRTMSTSAGAYSPLSYHCGSVWPHDTAIVALGLARAGFDDQAAELAMGLVRAAADLDFRLPELFSGDAADDVGAVVPYPAACHPQAWAAAAGVVALQILLGLRIDGPGRLSIAPPSSMPAGALRVSGLRWGAGELAFSVDRSGQVADLVAPPEVEISRG